MTWWTRRRPSAKLGRNFSRLWGATAVSSLGDGIYLAALPMLALQFTHDPRQLGLIGAAGELPWLLLALHAGALVDRWDHRRVMWRVDTASTAARRRLPRGACPRHGKRPHDVGVDQRRGSTPLLVGGAVMVLVAGLFYPALNDRAIQEAIDAMRESESASVS